MKKISITLLMVLVTLLWMPLSYAQEIKPYDYPVNLLKLSNLMTPIGSYEIAQTIDPIAVNSQEMHTLILSYAFIGQHQSYIEYESLIVTHLPSHSETSYEYISDSVKGVVYVEFIPTESWIHLSGIPASPDGYQATLIKGDYASYTGYLPHIDPSTKLETQGQLSMDVDDPLSLEQIQSYIQAKSPQGTIIGYEIISDDYTLSQKRPGTYEISFMTTYMDMYHILYLNIFMYDLTPPSITFEGTKVTIPLAEKWSIETIKALITISDNVDTLSTSDLVIISDTYSHALEVGMYSITFEVSDSSGNTSTLIMPIELVDLKGPDINGPMHIYIYTEDTPLTYLDIYNYFEIIDDVDGSNITWSFVVDHYNQTRNPGKYLMTIQARDQQLNATHQDFYIHVVNNSAPYFELNELIIEVSAQMPVTESQLITWFTNQLLNKGIETDDVTITFNEYEHHKNLSGSYYVYVSYDIDSKTYLSRIHVIVHEENRFPMTLIIVSGSLLMASVGYLVVKKFKKS